MSGLSDGFSGGVVGGFSGGVIGGFSGDVVDVVVVSCWWCVAVVKSVGLLISSFAPLARRRCDSRPYLI